MPIEAQKIEDLIRKKLPDAEIRIEDLRGDGDHYAAYVSCSCFEGKTRIQQHQMIYAALEGADIHALAIQTSVPKN